MNRNSQLRQFLPPMLTALAFVVGCAIMDGSAPTAGGTAPKEDTEARIERWECGGYINGCGGPGTDCVTLTAYLDDGVGEVRFAESTEFAEFEVQGLERRWDWSPGPDGSYDYALVISVDGRGKYYDFRVSDDGTAKLSDRFKCKKR